MATYKQLLEQKAKLESQLEAARDHHRQEGLEKIHALMEEYDLSAEDILGKRRAARKTGPVPAKYRDPKTGATWSGRGRAPAWIGKNRDKFLIAEA
ncbi:H-NS family nucleoid-associated regulatory protein [Ralstonia sp. ASV6]|uniref:H-NS histone family protein n=1 Tax=Ralstonia sp. ASV6 TaxID=2795124 RepID=UPI0018ED874B|nr:H-NS histone family protein [Ralstonia sp. ASV6]